MSPDLRRESFIAMDQLAPQTRSARPVAAMFTPTHLDQLPSTSRTRPPKCLDHLPRNAVFDWVDEVSIELTTQMLAVLFDFPWEDRRKLTRWSDVATTIPVRTAWWRRRRAAGRASGMRDLFRRLWERAHQSATEERPVVDDGAQARPRATWTRGTSSAI